MEQRSGIGCGTILFFGLLIYFDVISWGFVWKLMLFGIIVQLAIGLFVFMNAYFRGK